MEEAQLEESISMYSLQLEQVQSAIVSGAEDNPELISLRDNLKQLLELTEDALLNLKKSKLLASLEETNSDDSHSFKETGGQATADFESEFAAFQAEVGEESSCSLKNETIEEATPSVVVAAADDDDAEDEDEDGYASSSDEEDEAVDELSGTKCVVPFSHEWGEKRLHAAMILNIEKTESRPCVRVLFCHPTHRSMVPCPFYLDGKCRFTEDKCRYSHGYVVDVDELQPYSEPDHGSLSIESHCLARDSDGVWYPAVVVETANDEHQLQVMFDSNEHTRQVGLEEVVPLNKEADDAASDEEELVAKQPLSEDEEEEDNALPVFLWRPGQTNDTVGNWEAHTRGIASKLMSKMGYVAGEGLGRQCQGRAEPIPIQLLPQGKSLDKIMELKQLAGDQDLYDVMKKQEKEKKMTEKKNAAIYTREKKKEKSSVFDFINKKLHGKKGKIESLARHVGSSHCKHKVTHIAEHELQAKSDRHINIQHLKTSDEIKKTEKEVTRLKSSLIRSKSSRDQSMVAHYEQKLASTEAYLSQLKSSQLSLEKHRDSRKEHKKLTVF